MLQSIEESGTDSGSEKEDDNNNEEYMEPWVRIQQNTFVNWMNDKLRVFDLECTNLAKDLKDGVALCRLMQVLKNDKIGRVKVKKRMSQIEASGNLALALQAMKEDGVKLVNIGASDVAGGNVKLILGLLWSLIRHYQIGSQSKLPPKKLMLSWVNAVLHPHRKINNFSTDWNDGVALHGIIEFCKRGTFPKWYELSASDRLANCDSAMSSAQLLFEIPLVVTPQNLASRDLDELSGMTYLSYFMSVGSPGYKATLEWVRGQISSTPVDNFDKDWNNGFVLSSLVYSLGGVIPGWPNFNTSDWIGTLTLAMDVSQSQLGVEPVLAAKDMVHENVDHIGVMAYAAWHIHVADTPEEPVSAPPAPPPPLVVAPPPPVVTPPTPPPEPEVEEEAPPPVPVEVFAVPPVEPDPPPKVVTPEPLVRIAENWQIHTVHTIVVFTKTLGAVHVKAVATAPDGRNVDLTSSQPDDVIHYVSFLPTVIGAWTIKLTALDNKTGDEVPIHGGPFSVNVYDSKEVLLDRDQEKSTLALGADYSFTVHCSDCGLQDLDVYVLYDGETYEHSSRAQDDMSYDVTFTGTELGLYTVALYSGGREIEGSPFEITCKDLSKVTCSGPGLKTARLGHETTFTVDYSQGQFGHVSVKVTSPKGDLIDTPVRVTDTGLAEITYTPPLPGEYQIEVFYDNLPVAGGPYTVPVSNKKVFIKDVKAVSYVGEMDGFIVDASDAGKGQLEIDSGLPIRDYKSIGERVYSISYVPKKPGRHDLSVKYNGMVVEGCPCTIDVQIKPPEEQPANGDIPTNENGEIPTNENGDIPSNENHDS